MRRADTIFFGSLVFTVVISSLAGGVLSNQGVVNFKDDTGSALAVITTAAGISVVVSAVDWILGKIE